MKKSNKVFRRAVVTSGAFVPRSGGGGGGGASMTRFGSGGGKAKLGKGKKKKNFTKPGTVIPQGPTTGGGRGGGGRGEGRTGPRSTRMRAKVRSLLTEFYRTSNPSQAKSLLDEMESIYTSYGDELGEDLLREIEEAQGYYDTTWPGEGDPYVDPILDEQIPEGHDSYGGDDDPLNTLPDKMAALEQLLGMKGKGKKLFKQKWRKVRIVLGNIYKATEGGAIAADDARLAMSKARQVTDEGAASFGRSVGPWGQGATEGGTFVPYDPLTNPMLYEEDPSMYEDPYAYGYDEYGNPIYDPYGYDPYGYDPYGSATASDFTAGFPIDDASIIYNSEPFHYRPLPTDDYWVPDMPPSWAEAYSIPEPPEQWDDFGGAPPITEDDYMIGGGPKSSPMNSEAYDDGLMGMSAAEENADLYAPSVACDDIDRRYNSASIDSSPVPDPATAQRVVGLIEDALDDVTSLLRDKALPAFADLKREAVRTRDPQLVSHVNGAMIALRDALRYRQQGLSDLHALEDAGLDGLPLVGPLWAAVKGSGLLTIAAAVAALTATGLLAGGARSAIDSLSTGAKWGLGIGLPMAGALWAGSKFGLGDEYEV